MLSIMITFKKQHPTVFHHIGKLCLSQLIELAACPGTGGWVVGGGLGGGWWIGVWIIQAKLNYTVNPIKAITVPFQFPYDV